MNFRKILSLIFALAILFGLCSCKDKTDNKNESETSSTITKTIDISNTTVKEISQKLSASSLPESFTLTLKTDRINENPALAIYEIAFNGNAVAKISISSDLENKAAFFNLEWKFSEDKTLVENLTAISNTVLKCAWTDYNEKALESLNRNFDLTVDCIERMIDYNMQKTAAGKNGGYISLSTNSKTVILTVCYPNIVENV